MDVGTRAVRHTATWMGPLLNCVHQDLTVHCIIVFIYMFIVLANDFLDSLASVWQEKQYFERTIGLIARQRVKAAMGRESRLAVVAQTA